MDVGQIWIASASVKLRADIISTYACNLRWPRNSLPTHLARRHRTLRMTMKQLIGAATSGHQWKEDVARRRAARSWQHERCISSALRTSPAKARFDYLLWIDGGCRGAAVPRPDPVTNAVVIVSLDSGCASLAASPATQGRAFLQDNHRVAASGSDLAARNLKRYPNIQPIG